MFIKEEQKLREAGIEYERQPGAQSCIVHFDGPKDTPYADTRYTLDIVPPPEWPFKAPEAFFIGKAPQHRFYAFDDADGQRQRTRTTNLANTNFGLYYGCWSSQLCFVDYVERVKYSMTPSGEAEMKDFMCAQDK